MESGLSRKIVKQQLKIYKSQILSVLYKCTEIKLNLIFKFNIWVVIFDRNFHCLILLLVVYFIVWFETVFQGCNFYVSAVCAIDQLQFTMHTPLFHVF